jgi:hypothetical protein
VELIVGKFMEESNCTQELSFKLGGRIVKMLAHGKEQSPDASN